MSGKRQVPETHKATLTIVGKGTVTVNGQTCEGEVSHMEVKIPRLTETEWKSYLPCGSGE